MSKSPRYLFVLPDVDRPVGGVNVALHFAKVLSDAGYDVGALHAATDYLYRFHGLPEHVYSYAPLAGVPKSFMGKRGKLRAFARGLSAAKEPVINAPLEIRPSDVFVIPEFWYPEYCALFPDNPKILFLQVVFGFCEALVRDIDAGTKHIDNFDAVVTISKATHETAKQFGGYDSYLVRQSVVRSAHDPSMPKKRQIAYMPRKRAEEVALFIKIIQRNPVFDDWGFKPIDGLTPDAVDAILNESLIFLSFSHQEGFGLPPAEAMAAGCIVIGYTGVAGEEFFTKDTGIPIMDSDIVSYAAALQDVVTEYDRDPKRLNRLRSNAASFIAGHYNPDNMQDTLLTAWEDIERRLTS